MMNSPNYYNICVSDKKNWKMIYLKYLNRKLLYWRQYAQRISDSEDDPPLSIIDTKKVDIAIAKLNEA